MAKSLWSLLAYVVVYLVGCLAGAGLIAILKGETQVNWIAPAIGLAVLLVARLAGWQPKSGVRSSD